MVTAACRPEPVTSPITTHSCPEGRVNTVIPVAAHRALPGHVAGRQLRPAEGRQRGRKQAALQRRSRGPILLGHQRSHRGRGPVRGKLQQLHVAAGELAWRQRADVHDPDHPAASDQRHTHQGTDSLRPQDRVQHRRVIDVIEDHRPVLGGDTPGKAPAHRDPHALAHLLLQADRSGGDQLPRRKVQQQHRGRVGPQDCLGALQQLSQQRMIIKTRQGSIGDRLDVPEPVLYPGQACLRGHITAS
jgi:hypothetical protein